MEKDLSNVELLRILTSQTTDKKTDISVMKTNIAKDMGKIKTDTLNIIIQKQQETLTMFNLHKKQVQEQLAQLRKNSATNVVLDREITIVGHDDSALPQTVQQAENHIPKQCISEKLRFYLKESYEDEIVLNAAEWLINQLSENREVLSIKALAPILDIKNPRATIINAIHNYHEQCQTLEGSEN